MIVDRRTMLASGAALATGALATRAMGAEGADTVRFPEGFIWGASTAGHQVEGNNVNSDCWLLEHTDPTVYSEPSGDAANSFELWPIDMQLVKNLNLGAYRFSLEWARIEPVEGTFSIAMLDHYKRMIARCREMGIRPFVTFNHFTTPIWFAARGGWMRDDAPDLYARFADRAARHLADGIDHAMTLNEPNLSGVLQEVLPGALFSADQEMMEAAARKLGVDSFLAGNALYQPDRETVQKHLRAAHSAGRAAIKAVRGDLPVGVTLAMIDEQEAEPGSLRDSVRERFYGPWLRLAREDDFIGVQNYERHRWTKSGQLPPPEDARTNYSGSEVYAPSLAGAVRYAYEMAQVPVIVTEHGVGTDDDSLRAWLIPAALKELHKAMGEGIPVKGYCHWSLIDNFEWVFGYRPTFGLHSLDRTTFARTPKYSALVYAAIAKNNAV